MMGFPELKDADGKEKRFKGGDGSLGSSPTDKLTTSFESLTFDIALRYDLTSEFDLRNGMQETSLPDRKSHT
jgi:hypothetical protein